MLKMMMMGMLMRMMTMLVVRITNEYVNDDEDVLVAVEPIAKCTRLETMSLPLDETRASRRFHIQWISLLGARLDIKSK